MAFARPSFIDATTTGADPAGTAAAAVAVHEAAADPHTGYQKESEKGAVSGYASLNASQKVVEDPANATATPTLNKIPIADGAGKLDGWISPASTSTAGKVQLCTDGETAANKAVTGNDARLSNARTPAITASADNRRLRANGTTGVQDSSFQDEDSVEGTWAHNDTKAAFTVPATVSQSYMFTFEYMVFRTAGGGAANASGQIRGVIAVNSSGVATVVHDSVNNQGGTLNPTLNRSLSTLTYQVQIVTAPGDTGTYAFFPTLRVANRDMRV